MHFGFEGSECSILVTQLVGSRIEGLGFRVGEEDSGYGSEQDMNTKPQSLNLKQYVGVAGIVFQAAR